MDDCQLYSALLELKVPWKVDRVDLNPVKKIVDIFIVHEKGSKLPCPICRKDCMVYDHLNERVWRDLDSVVYENHPCIPSESILCRAWNKGDSTSLD